MPRGQPSPDALALSGIHQLTISAGGAEARRASAWLDATCRHCGVPQTHVERLALCLEEVLANINAHGGDTALAAPIRLLLENRCDHDGHCVTVTVSDAGIAFDPRSVAEKTLPGTLADASPGGLGLVMIRRCADWLDYRHEDGCNHLTFGARWTAS